MGAPQLQFGGGHLLQQHRERPADHGERSERGARDAIHRRPGGGDVRRARRQGASLRVPGRGRSGRRSDLRRTDAALYRGRQVLLRDSDPQGDAGIHRGVPAQVPRPAGDPDHAADRARILREEAVFHVPVLFTGG